ncbi:hypothetical protein L4C34_12385 [Vibrio profundum]
MDNLDRLIDEAMVLVTEKEINDAKDNADKVNKKMQPDFWATPICI